MEYLCSAWFKKGLTVTPNVNLVSNIGFRDDATHTLDSNDKNANLPIGGIGKIIHPNKVSLNLEADKYNFDNFYNGQYLRFPNNLFRLPRKIIGLILRKLKIMKIIRYKN